MADQSVGSTGAEHPENLEDVSRSGRPRLALVVVLLLLLLMAIVSTIADLWATAPTSEQKTAIMRNIECLGCHVELLPQYAMQARHNPFLFKRCTVCHTPHGEIVRSTRAFGPVERWQRLRTLIEWLPLRIACDVSLNPFSSQSSPGSKAATSVRRRKGKDSHLTMPLTELCWMCHGKLGPKLNSQYPHNPFEAGRCTTCHNPHASDFPRLLTQDLHDLCVTCHPIGLQINRAQGHPPVVKRHCTTCHDPHGSDYRGMIVRNQRDLCFSCHDTVSPLALKAVQHRPFEINCTGCHEPHGSDYFPLLRNYPPALCYRCHATIRYDFAKASHHPVGTVRLNCPDCHSPHAADNDFLLSATGNQFCYTCHAQSNGHAYAIKRTFQSSAHWVEKRMLCIRCHTPHGSSFAPLLRKRNPELCLDCHSSTVVGHKKHAYRPSLWDPAARKPLTCTSTCHNPHGTDQNYMLKRFSWPLDGQCLQCHGIVPGQRVGVDF